MTEDVEEEVLGEAGQVAVGGDGEQLVGEVHHDAVVAGGVVGERGLELVGHEAGVAGGGEEVIEAGEQLVAGGVVGGEEPRGKSSAVRRRSGRRASPEKTTQRSCFESKSLLARMRSSLRTVVRASWASSMMSTGRIRVEVMCSLQRVRSALNPAQRLWMVRGMPKRSPSSR